MAETLFDKIWQAHEVADLGDGMSLILVDRVLLHERTGAIALRNLEESGRALASPEHIFCMVDHIVDTLPGRTGASLVPGGEKFITALRDAAGLRVSHSLTWTTRARASPTWSPRNRASPCRA